MTKKQKVLSQVKGQDKTPEKQLNEVGTGNLSEKTIQSYDSEDDLGSWGKIGDDVKESIAENWSRRINDLEDRMVEITATEQNIEKRMKIKMKTARDLWKWKWE